MDTSGDRDLFPSRAVVHTHLYTSTGRFLLEAALLEVCTESTRLLLGAD